MPRRIIKALLILTLIGGAVSYLFYFNPSVATVVIGRDRIWQAPMALIVLVVFVSGFISAGSLALLFNARTTFDSWKERRRNKIWKSHRDELVRGRELFALAQYDSAANVFQNMLEQDSANVQARVELARSLVKLGKMSEALHALDAGRQLSLTNAELLVTAAEFNSLQGNFTAAYDNLALLQQQNPDQPFTLEKLVAVATQVNRFQDALEFQKRLLRQPGANTTAAQERLAELELKVAENSGLTGEARRAALDEVLRRHRDYAPALARLAELEREANRPEAATKLWLKAYGLSGDIRYLRELSTCWLSRGEPTKALASVKSALDSFRADSLDASGRLFLVQFLLHLEMLDEAEEQLNRLQTEGGLPPRLAVDKAFLRCKIGLRRGRGQDAMAELLDSLERNSKLNDLSGKNSSSNGASTSEARALRAGLEFSGKKASSEARPPSPRLSTP